MTTAVKDGNELRGPLIIKTISKLCLSLCWRFYKSSTGHGKRGEGVNEFLLYYMSCHTPLHARPVSWERSLRDVNKVSVVRPYPHLLLYQYNHAPIYIILSIIHQCPEQPFNQARNLLFVFVINVAEKCFLTLNTNSNMASFIG